MFTMLTSLLGLRYILSTGLATCLRLTNILEMSKSQNITPSISSLRALLPEVTDGPQHVSEIPAPGISQPNKQIQHRVEQEKKLAKEQIKLKEDIQQLTSDLLQMTSAMHLFVKKQDLLDSTSENLKKKMKSIEGQNTTIQDKTSKQIDKIKLVDCQVKEIKKQMKLLKEQLGCVEGNKNIALVGAIQAQLKDMEDDIVGIFQKAVNKVEQTSTKIKSLEESIDEMKLHMLTILDHCESNDTSPDTGSKLLFQLVKEQVTILKRDVTLAYENSIDRVEKVNIVDQKQIKKLENILKNEIKRNDNLAMRIANLEKERHSDTKQIRSNQSEISHLKSSLKDESKKNNRLEQRISKIEKMFQEFETSYEGYSNSTGRKYDVSTPSSSKAGASKQTTKSKGSLQSESKKKQEKHQSSKAGESRNTTTGNSKSKESRSKTSSSSNSLNSKESTTRQQNQRQTVGKNQSAGLQSKNTAGNEDMSYFQKAQVYLLSQLESNLQGAQNAGAGFSATILDQKAIVKEPILQQSPIDWAIRKQRENTSVLSIQYGSIFYTKTPGYRMQFRVQIDQLHGDLYFSARILRGVFDDQLKWPFTGTFKIRVNHKATKKNHQYDDWKLPPKGLWEQNMRRAVGKRDRVYSEWIGPFDISHLLERDTFYLLIDLGEEEKK